MEPSLWLLVCSVHLLDRKLCLSLPNNSCSSFVPLLRYFTTAENAAHIKKISELKTENRTLKADREQLQYRLDDELFAGSSWKKEKDRFEMGLGSFDRL